jgi:signal transduction histidine kinase
MRSPRQYYCDLLGHRVIAVTRGYRDLVDFTRSPAGEFAVVAAVGVVVFGATLLLAYKGVTVGVGVRPLWPGGIGLMSISVAALAWRRQQPVVALVLTASSAAVYYVLDFPAGFEPLPFVVTLYGVAVQGRRIVAGVAAVLAAVLVWYVELFTVARDGPAEPHFVLGWLVVVIVFAEVVRGRRAYLLEVEQRALEAEHGREAEAARRVVEERLRIARELHDALAHQISVISVQAGAAILRQDTKPELAHEVMPTIRQAATDAMRELRAALGVLRNPDETGPLAPRPGLERLAELVARTEAAGPTVCTEIRGERRPVPTDVDLAAYRILQEALTNVTRHARDATATVLLDYRADELELRVDDDGTTTPSLDTGSGNGLVGMRERAAAIGGVLDAGPRAGGGFAVRATLPLHGNDVVDGAA